MAKATIVKITRINKRGTVVCTASEKIFTIISFDKIGVLKIEAETTDMTIDEFAEIVAGCFETRSSFRGVGWIHFTYDNVTAYVTRGEAINYPTEYIVNKWKKAWDDKNVNSKLEKFSAYVKEDIDE